MGRYGTGQGGGDAVDAGFALPTQALEDLARRVAALEARLRWGHGSPENVVLAAPGALWADVDSGDVYRKTSAADERSGWVALT